MSKLKKLTPLLAFLVWVAGALAQSVTLGLGSGAGTAAQGSNTISVIAGAGVSVSGSPATIGNASSPITVTNSDHSHTITFVGSGITVTGDNPASVGTASNTITFTAQPSATVAHTHSATAGDGGGTLVPTALTIPVGSNNPSGTGRIYINNNDALHQAFNDANNTHQYNLNGSDLATAPLEYRRGTKVVVAGDTSTQTVTFSTAMANTPLVILSEQGGLVAPLNVVATTSGFTFSLAAHAVDITCTWDARPSN